MKYLPIKGLVAAIASIVIALAVSVSAAEASSHSGEDSVYPGTERLLTGDNAQRLGRSLGWLERCNHRFDYRGYLKNLKEYSRADWRYFKSQSGVARSQDRATGCQSSNTSRVVETLGIYANSIKDLAEKCKGKAKCSHAGQNFGVTVARATFF